MLLWIAATIKEWNIIRALSHKKELAISIHKISGANDAADHNSEWKY